MYPRAVAGGMPTIELTDAQAERFERLREELSATIAGPYASVSEGDTMAYLLDLAEAVEEPSRYLELEPDAGVTTGERRDATAADPATDGETPAEAAEADARDEVDESGDGDEDADSNSDSDESGGADGMRARMMNLLEDHADKWRPGEDDVGYEVDLPDGSTETARTKDDVKAILFRHY